MISHYEQRLLLREFWDVFIQQSVETKEQFVQIPEGRSIAFHNTGKASLGPSDKQQAGMIQFSVYYFENPSQPRLLTMQKTEQQWKMHFADWLFHRGLHPSITQCDTGGSGEVTHDGDLCWQLLRDSNLQQRYTPAQSPSASLCGRPPNTRPNLRYVEELLSGTAVRMREEGVRKTVRELGLLAYQVKTHSSQGQGQLRQDQRKKIQSMLDTVRSTDKKISCGKLQAKLAAMQQKDLSTALQGANAARKKRENERVYLDLMDDLNVQSYNTGVLVALHHIALQNCDPTLLHQVSECWNASCASDAGDEDAHPGRAGTVQQTQTRYKTLCLREQAAYREFLESHKRNANSEEERAKLDRRMQVHFDCATKDTSDRAWGIYEQTKQQKKLAEMSLASTARCVEHAEKKWRIARYAVFDLLTNDTGLYCAQNITLDKTLGHTQVEFREFELHSKYFD